MDSWRRTFTFVGAIVLVLAVVVATAPVERTLGAGIRAVYVHVALSLAGVAGFVVAAALGGWSAVTGSTVTARWLVPVAGTAIGFFAAGTAASALAAWINWGGVFLGEPLFRSSLVVLSSSFLSFSLSAWTRHVRLRGLWSLGPAVAVTWVLLGTPMLLHPGGGVVSGSAASIRWTFVVATALCVAAAARISVWLVGPRSSS